MVSFYTVIMLFTHISFYYLILSCRDYFQRYMTKLRMERNGSLAGLSLHQIVQRVADMIKSDYKTAKVSIYLFVCLSVCPACLSIYLSVCLSVCLSCLPISLSCLPACLSVCLSCLSVCLSSERCHSRTLHAQLHREVAGHCEGKSVPP